MYRKASACIMIFILAFSGCHANHTKTDYENKRDEPLLYLYNSSSDALESVQLYLNGLVDTNNKDQIVKYVVRLLSDGISSKRLEATIDSSVNLLYYGIEDDNLVLNFDTNFYELTQKQKMLMCASLVKSLTSFKKISSVEFYIDGSPLYGSKGEAMGPLTSEDIIIDNKALLDERTIDQLLIYVPTSDGKWLEAEKKDVEIDPNKKMEQVIIETLLSNDDYDIMPSGSQLLNVYTHDGVCFVDFNDAFINSPIPDGLNERLVIYALVNSLTNLTSVSQVQILVEGQIVSSFHGTFRLDRLLSKNFALLEVSGM